MAPKIICLGLIFWSANVLAADFVRTQILMGDVPVTIKVQTSITQKEKAFQAMEEAYNRAKEIKSKVSEYQTGSDTSRLNRHAGKGWLSIGPDLYQLLLSAREISEVTGGAFDITFASRKKGVNFQDVILSGSKTLKAKLNKRSVQIGVSGVAKGYIIDQMSTVLKKAGFKKFIVNAGGDLYAAGKWQVTIRDLKNKKLTVKNKAVTSSGLAERGKHLIDPRNQQPVSPNYYSVTGISDQAVTGNGLTLACFVAGADYCDEKFEKKNGIKLIYGKQ